MSRRFDPILFDLDGTLIDSSKDIASAINRTLAGLGLPSLAEDEIIGYVGDGVRKLMERTLRRFSKHRTNPTERVLDPSQVDRAIQLFRADYRKNCLVHTKPYPGVHELLRDLAGLRVGVVTNKPIDFARTILDGLGMSSYLQSVVGGDETDQLKPHPQPILLACQRLGVQPASGIMAGDFRTDMESGRSAGMTVCGVLWGFDHGVGVRSARPDFLCASVDELRAILLTG